MVFSATRSNQEGSLGFVRDARRLNVALTRAKRGVMTRVDIKVPRPTRGSDFSMRAGAQVLVVGREKTLAADGTPI